MTSQNKIITQNLILQYSDGTESLKDISLNIPRNAISVLFGPAGGGKSTFLRVLNRLNDLANVKEMSGSAILYSDISEPLNILDPNLDVTSLRRRVGMVFARPVVLPMSIKQNLTYGLEVAGLQDKKHQNQAVERSLKQAALWDEVKDRLNDPAVKLSGGQQQRLCIARSLALEPEVLLLDEPTSGLDPLSTGKVEASLQELKKEYTIVLVPHSVQQAARTADFAAFFLQGELIEYASGKEMFTNPTNQQSADYIEGRFG